MINNRNIFSPIRKHKMSKFNCAKCYIDQFPLFNRLQFKFLKNIMRCHRSDLINEAISIPLFSLAISIIGHVRRGCTYQGGGRGVGWLHGRCRRPPISTCHSFRAKSQEANQNARTRGRSAASKDKHNNAIRGGMATESWPI